MNIASDKAVVDSCLPPQGQRAFVSSAMGFSDWAKEQLSGTLPKCYLVENQASWQPWVLARVVGCIGFVDQGVYGVAASGPGNFAGCPMVIQFFFFFS